MMAEKKDLLKSLAKLMEISAGRFVAYILFGALAGYFGSNIEPLSRDVFTGVSYILLSVFLLLNVFRTHREGKSCRMPRWAAMSKSAFLLGLFTGINFCPSFLIALSSAVNLGGVLSGMQIFLGFFFGTTIFLLPLALSSYLTILKEVKSLARIASILIAVWFIFQGGHNLYTAYQVHRHQQNTYMLDLAEFPFQAVIVATGTDSSDATILSDSLATLYTKPTLVIQTDDADGAILPSNKENTLLLLFEDSLADSTVSSAYQSYHHIVIRPGNARRVTNFLRQTRFRLDLGQKMSFKI